MDELNVESVAVCSPRRIAEPRADFGPVDSLFWLAFAGESELIAVGILEYGH